MSQQPFMHEVAASDTRRHSGAVSSRKHPRVHGLATESTARTPDDSIYSKWAPCIWKESRDPAVEGCCAFELQSLTFHRLRADHANDKKSVAWGPARPFYHHQISRHHECQRVICGRRWPARQAESSSCTQTQPFSHQCVLGGTEAWRPACKDGSPAHAAVVA